jgi:hypothetical protein
MANRAGTNLGALVVEKRLSKGGGIFMLAFALLFLIAGVALFSESPPLAIFGLLASVAFIWLGVTLITKRYEIHQNGVSESSAFGTTSIAFSSVRTIGYALVRQGASKRVTLALIPATGKPLNVSLGLDVRQEDDPDLGAVRDRLSKTIATRMEDVLKRRGTVEWIERGSIGAISFPALSITRDGFTIDDGKTKSSVRSSEVSLEVKDGYVFVNRTGDRKNLFTCRALTPNVYPGLELLGRIRSAS